MTFNASHLQTCLSRKYPKAAIEFSFSCVAATKCDVVTWDAALKTFTGLALLLQGGVALVNTSIHKCLSSELNSVNCFAFLFLFFFFRLSLRLCPCVQLCFRINSEPFTHRITWTGSRPTGMPLTSYYHTQHGRSPSPASFRELKGKHLSQSLSRSKCYCGRLYSTLFCYIVHVLCLRLYES